jgi:hypothetical protein
MKKRRQLVHLTCESETLSGRGPTPTVLVKFPPQINEKPTAQHIHSFIRLFVFMYREPMRDRAASPA